MSSPCGHSFCFKAVNVALRILKFERTNLTISAAPVGPVLSSMQCCWVQLSVESLSTACKCHGVSGSCSMRTCWKSLADLRAVAVTLLDRYSHAVEVVYRRASRRRSDTTTASSGDKQLVPVQRRRRTLNDTDIAYYTMSPDYCLPDASVGSVGTKHRYTHLLSSHLSQ